MSRLAIICAVLQASILVACASNPVAAPVGGGTAVASWHLSAIDARPAWSVTRGEGVLVAILDSGVSFEALPAVRRRAAAGFNAIDGSSSVEDDSGHGTAVTSVAVGSGDDAVWGVAPSARVLPIVVADSHGQALPEDVAEGVRRAVALGAAVINLSLGSVQESGDLGSAIAEATSRHVIVVAASGDGASQASLFPASLAATVIAARSADVHGSPTVTSNQVGSNGIDAPGDNIPAVTVSGVGTSWHSTAERAGGSSMAAAIVTGGVALLLACARRLGHGLERDAVLGLLRGSAAGRPYFDLASALAAEGCPPGTTART